MSSLSNKELRRLDDAARAGWLYYVAGNTQDDIAKKMGVSRQSAQRLVALSVNSGLIKVRLDHPIANCMNLAEQIKEAFDLEYCDVVPSDPSDPSSIIGLSQASANALEKFLKPEEPQTIALGTGRALKACVEELTLMDCKQHRIVSMLGNMASDGSSSAYGVVDQLGDKVNAKHYPMSMPVIFSTPKEMHEMHDLPHLKFTIDLAKQADAILVGIGNLGNNSPLYIDGFITKEELNELEQQGAVGELISWVFDQDGNLLNNELSQRVASVPLEPSPNKPVYGIAAGEHKVNAIVGALKSKRINGLITNEYTAQLMLATLN